MRWVAVDKPGRPGLYAQYVKCLSDMHFYWGINAAFAHFYGAVNAVMHHTQFCKMTAPESGALWLAFGEGAAEDAACVEGADVGRLFD